MSSSEWRQRPSLAKAEDDCSDTFGAFLATALHNESAARGLAHAYSCLTAGARVELVDAVVTDAAAEGIGALPILAGLLSVEDDPQVARHIACVMSTSGEHGRARPEPCHAFMAGDENEGAVIIARPLHDEFVELLSLAWHRDHGLTHWHFDPMIEERRAEEQATRGHRGRSFERIPAAFAIDVLAPVLWNHRRRHGELPREVARFADLFSVG